MAKTFLLLLCTAIGVGAERPLVSFHVSEASQVEIGSHASNAPSSGCPNGFVCCEQENNKIEIAHQKEIVHFCAKPKNCSIVTGLLTRREVSDVGRESNDLCNENSRVAQQHKQVCPNRFKSACCRMSSRSLHGNTVEYGCMPPPYCVPDWLPGTVGKIGIYRRIANESELHHCRMPQTRVPLPDQDIPKLPLQDISKPPEEKILEEPEDIPKLPQDIPKLPPQDILKPPEEKILEEPEDIPKKLPPQDIPKPRREDPRRARATKPPEEKILEEPEDIPSYHRRTSSSYHRRTSQAARGGRS